jgi:branched-chain amino acid aminotransferase
VENGRIYVPPLAEGILDSITRRRVMDANEVTEEHCPIDRLKEADEAFAAGTSFEVAPVLAVEGIREWAAAGPISLAAKEATQALIRSELDADREALGLSSPV